MAIAVPLLLGATGASAAIAGAMTTAFGLAAGAVTAGMVTLGAGVLTAATGLGGKIDRAASKVFGEDLVKTANIAGSIYMAFGGGFGGEAAAAERALPEFADPSGGYGFEGADSLMPMEYGARPPAPNFGLQGMPSNVPSIVTQNAGALSRFAENGQNLLQKGAQAWSSMDPRTQSALVQAGGSMLSGYAQGKQAEAELEERRKQDERYRSGPSGGSRWAQWYMPPNPVPR